MDMEIPGQSDNSSLQTVQKGDTDWLVGVRGWGVLLIYLDLVVLLMVYDFILIQLLTMNSDASHSVTCMDFAILLNWCVAWASTHTHTCLLYTSPSPRDDY